MRDHGSFNVLISIMGRSCYALPKVMSKRPMAVSLGEVVSGLALMFFAVLTYPRVLCSLLMDLVRCKMSIGCSVMDCSRTPTRFAYSLVLTL